MASMVSVVLTEDPGVLESCVRCGLVAPIGRCGGGT